MLISVVTITYNNFSELKETLESIHGMTEIESVVINGGKCADSRALLSSHSGKVLNEADEGISDAFNKGARLATGQAITYLNSGDLLLDREYYLWASRIFTEDPSVDFTYSDLLFVDPVAGEITMKPRALGGLNLGEGMPFPHPTMVVRREVFDKIGGFSKDYKIAMDFDFVVRMVREGFRGVYYPRMTVKMDGAGVSTAHEIKGIDESKKSLEAHGMFGRQEQLGYAKRLRNYQIRMTIKRLFGDSVLRVIKRIIR